MRPTVVGLLLAALHMAACGDDAGSTASAASSGSGGASSAQEAAASSGDGGSGGCGIDSPVACDAGHTSAVSVGPVTSATSTTSGAGGDGGAGHGGSGGDEGGGGSAPVCEAASCAFSDDANERINCREDCGPLDERCSTHVCVDDAEDETYLIGRGVTEILTPPLLEPVGACSECVAMLWTMRLRLSTDGTYGFAVDGPDSALMQLDATDPIEGPPPPAFCETSAASDAGGCIALDGNAEFNRLTLAIDANHPTGGARFRIENRVTAGIGGEDPPVPACAGGCNGEGATPP